MLRFVLLIQGNIEVLVHKVCEELDDKISTEHY